MILAHGLSGAPFGPELKVGQAKPILPPEGDRQDRLVPLNWMFLLELLSWSFTQSSAELFPTNTESYVKSTTAGIRLLKSLSFPLH